MALPEPWDFDVPDGQRPTFAILRNYLSYTFYKLRQEGEVLESESHGIAAFNTGLVGETYEPIFACFVPARAEQKWRFSGFCKAGAQGQGKALVRAFNPLPERARYFRSKQDLLYDPEYPFYIDHDHILIDNIHRLPLSFLREELRSDDEALAILDDIESSSSQQNQSELFDDIRAIVENNSRLLRGFISHFDDAVALARKRAEWNYRTTIPTFYPKKDIMCLLLPLDLTEDGIPDVALVMEPMETKAYLGQTILTMEMAYKNARLVCRPDSDWLDVKVCGR